MDEPLNKLAGYLSDRLGAKLIDAKVALGELTIEIPRGDLLEAIALLRDDALCHFGCLIDICGADYPDRVFSRAPTGLSARHSIFTASCSPATPIFAASSPITAFRVILCARTFH